MGWDALIYDAILRVEKLLREILQAFRVDLLLTGFGCLG